MTGKAEVCARVRHSEPGRWTHSGPTGPDRDFWRWWPSPDGALWPLPTTDTRRLRIGVPGDTAEPSRVRALVEERTGRSGIRVRRVVRQPVRRNNVPWVDRYRAGRVFLGVLAAFLAPMLPLRQPRVLTAGAPLGPPTGPPGSGSQ